MKKLAVTAALFICMPCFTQAQEKPKKVEVKKEKPKKVEVKKEKPKKVEVKKEKPIEIARDKYHRVMMVKKNKKFTKNWAFVIDSSHSTWKIASRVLTGFHTATQFPTDHLKFSTYVFHNQGVHKFRDWAWASPDEFTKTAQWVRSNRGVSSWASSAIRDALCGINPNKPYMPPKPQKELTIMIISDGGFTDGIKKIKLAIKAGQLWRVQHGYAPAIICAIGIENKLCWPDYPKKPNAVCQQGMRDIGVAGEGGFFYVQQFATRKKSLGKTASRKTAGSKAAK